eukprot:859523-Pyramimonas_sp.AAC.1
MKILTQTATHEGQFNYAGHKWIITGDWHRDPTLILGRLHSIHGLQKAPLQPTCNAVQPGAVRDY